MTKGCKSRLCLDCCEHREQDMRTLALLCLTTSLPFYTKTQEREEAAFRSLWTQCQQIRSIKGAKSTLLLGDM